MNYLDSILNVYKKHVDPECSIVHYDYQSSRSELKCSIVFSTNLIATRSVLKLMQSELKQILQARDPFWHFVEVDSDSLYFSAKFSLSIETGYKLFQYVQDIGLGDIHYSCSRRGDDPSRDAYARMETRIDKSAFFGTGLQETNTFKLYAMLLDWMPLGAMPMLTSRNLILCTHLPLEDLQEFVLR